MATLTYRDIITSGIPARDVMDALADRLPFLESEADRYAESCDLSGEGQGYADVQAELSSLIGKLKRAHALLGERRSHRHEWGPNDYCRTCGRDGRA